MSVLIWQGTVVLPLFGKCLSCFVPIETTPGLTLHGGTAKHQQTYWPCKLQIQIAFIGTELRSAYPSPTIAIWESNPRMDRSVSMYNFMPPPQPLFSCFSILHGQDDEKFLTDLFAQLTDEATDDDKRYELVRQLTSAQTQLMPDSHYGPDQTRLHYQAGRAWLGLIMWIKHKGLFGQNWPLLPPFSHIV